jgi:Uma2 family endonuclease
MQALSKEELYTYADYVKWETGNDRYELIDGVPYLMSAPSRRHQKIGGEIHGQLWQFLRGKPCEVYQAPLDVRLNYDKGDDTVVQPDLSVVCDKAKLDDKGIKGAPDMVIEILSASNSLQEMMLKYNKYLQAGVREYWIVDPEAKSVQANVLNDGAYIGRVYGDAADIPVHILEGFRINMRDVFAE